MANVDSDLSPAGAGDPTDESLMARLAGGEDRALDALMERWEKRLVSFVLRYTNHHADALDIAQETFVRVYKHRRRFRAGARFSTWLLTIAANLCKDHARWKERHPEFASGSPEAADESSRVEPTSDEGPDDRASTAEDAEIVRQAVRELPHDLRTAILLYEYEGLSHAEIGRILGCSAKAVESRLYRARRHLKLRLQALWNERRNG